MFEQFWQVAESLVPFSDKEKQVVESKLVPRVAPKNFTLIKAGDIAKEVYFINKGCIRYYYLTEEGKEITGFIFEENMFAGSHESYFAQVPGEQYVETIEECELLVLRRDDLESLYEKAPAMNTFVRKVLEQRFAHAQKVVASFILNKPEERYHELLKRRPGLINRVPQHILSTYMGITPVSLSRIRARKPKSD